MSKDREQLDNWLQLVADKYAGYEIVEILEDNGIIDVWQLIALLEDQIIEGKELFEL